MQNKTVVRIKKIIFIAVFSVAVAYISDSWKSYQTRLSMDHQNTDYSKTNINLTSIKFDSLNDVWFVKNDRPIVAYEIVFRNEGSRNFKNNPGILGLVIDTLFDGAGKFDSQTLKEKLIDSNISINVSYSKDDITISVYTIAENFQKSLDILSDICAFAHLKEDKLEKNKKQKVIALKQSKFSAESVTQDLMTQTIYDKDHPYYVSFDDVINNIPKYTRNDVIMVYNKIFDCRNAIITVSGGVDENSVKTNFEKFFKKLSAKKNDFDNKNLKYSWNKKGKIIYKKLNSPQTSLYFVFPNTLEKSKKKHAILLANMIFGGVIAPFNSRLFKNVRDVNGFVYEIGTFHEKNDIQSVFKGYALFSAENVNKVIDSVKKECQDFSEKGITREELSYYKTVVSSSNTLETSLDVVDYVSSCRLDNVDIKELNNYFDNFYNLSLEDVNKAIKEVFDYKKIIFVTVGNKEYKYEKNN